MRTRNTHSIGLITTKKESRTSSSSLLSSCIFFYSSSMEATKITWGKWKHDWEIFIFLCEALIKLLMKNICFTAIKKLWIQVLDYIHNYVFHNMQSFKNGSNYVSLLAQMLWEVISIKMHYCNLLCMSVDHSTNIYLKKKQTNTIDRFYYGVLLGFKNHEFIIQYICIYVYIIIYLKMYRSKIINTTPHFGPLTLLM